MREMWSDLWPSPARSSVASASGKGGQKEEDRRYKQKAEGALSKLQIHLDQGNGKCQSDRDRSQVIGGGNGKFLIGQPVGSLGNLGYLTCWADL